MLNQNVNDVVGTAVDTLNALSTIVIGAVLVVVVAYSIAFAVDSVSSPMPYDGPRGTGGSIVLESDIQPGPNGDTIRYSIVTDVPRPSTRLPVIQIKH